MTEHSLRQTGLALVSSALLVIALAGPLSAADPAAGEALARQWCSSCHVVTGDQTSGGDGAPPFTAIAADPTMDRAYLKTWLAQPHDPMPDLSLTAREIDDLIAYIESLSKE